MLERSKRYVNNARMDILMNIEQFIPHKYGKNTFQKKSKLLTRQFNTHEPTFAIMETSIDSLEDETSFFNIGQFYE